MEGLNGIVLVGVMIGIFGFQYVRVNEQCRVAVIVLMMRMEKGAGDQCEEHHRDAQKCTELLHVVKFCGTSQSLSTTTPAQ
jgi:hypothetical protein